MITQRVLIADQDSHTQEFVKRTLNRLQLRASGTDESVRFTTESVSTDEDAIRQLQHDPPDVAVMEHWAPNLNSVKILEALQAHGLDTTAIVLATRATIPAAVEAAKLGAFEFLAKPLTEQRLREVLSEVTGQRLDDVVSPVHFSRDDIQSSVSILSRIPAALANLATTAVSLHW